MITYYRLAIFVAISFFLPIYSSAAIDFDQDGAADFVLISVNQQDKLEWSAIDVNDSARRSAGELGVVGNHIAVGGWSADAKSSKAIINKKSSGDLEWTLDLTSSKKTFIFGTFPDKVISGLDVDKNGAIDPVVVAAGDKNLIWRVLLNPGVSSSPELKQFSFGNKEALPFFANPDGRGDQLATAAVNAGGVLTIRYKNVKTGKTKKVIINNFRLPLTSVYPVAVSADRDALFIVSKNGTRNIITIIYGKRRIQRVETGDEIVVGKYVNNLGEVMVVRNNKTATFIDPNGGTTELPLDLSGILVDDININSFTAGKETGGGGTTTPPSASRPNPVCTGTPISTEHLLYKPVSDTMGNAVLVFDSKYSAEFKSVKIELKDGTFTEAWWKGLVLWGNPDSNGPRQHWRTNVRASQVKDNALIIAVDSNQECRFVLPGSSNRRWE